MKKLIPFSILCISLNFGVFAEDDFDTARMKNTIILDEIGAKNLQLETRMAEEISFEQTSFSIGRIEEIPSKRSSLSSRIAGLAVEVNAFEGDYVKKGDVLVKVESRQPGNPPPTIELKAAQSGLIVTSHVLKGQPVDPETDLLDIADRSKVWAVAKIPEYDAAKIGKGAQARIRIPALGGDVINATLLRFGVSADSKSGAVEGIFEIDNPEGQILPGMRAEFSIITSHREDILAVAKNSIQGDPSKRVVYVKDFELPYAYIRVPIVLGEENDQFVEVISGLFPGDDVVTTGSYSLGFINSGSSISLKEALDAAHGHEHNEDGSELTASQKKGKQAQNNPEAKSAAPLNKGLLVYAVLATLALLFKTAVKK